MSPGIGWLPSCGYLSRSVLAYTRFPPSCDGISTVQSHPTSRRDLISPLLVSAGLYLLSEALRLGERPVVIRGDGVGVSRLIWVAEARSSGIVVTQSKQQHSNTDFTHVTGLSLWTRQLRKSTALTIDLTGAPNLMSG